MSYVALWHGGSLCSSIPQRKSWDVEELSFFPLLLGHFFWVSAVWLCHLLPLLRAPAIHWTPGGPSFSKGLSITICFISSSYPRQILCWFEWTINFFTFSFLKTSISILSKPLTSVVTTGALASLETLLLKNHWVSLLPLLPSFLFAGLFSCSYCNNFPSSAPLLYWSSYPHIISPLTLFCTP